MTQTEAVRDEGIYHRRLEAAGDRPLAWFLPKAYEPRYAYPLLVFLHGHGESERQWLDLVPQLSRRNYLAIGLRGPLSVGDGGYGWGRNRPVDAALEDYVLAGVEDIRAAYRVHPRRIYLAGCCEGASVAFRLGLSFPQVFAGMVAINGWLPAGPLPLSTPTRRFGAGGPAAFIGHGTENELVSAERADEAYRLLYAAGFSVQKRLYPADHRLSPAMLRDVDRWIMGRCR